MTAITKEIERKNVKARGKNRKRVGGRGSGKGREGGGEEGRWRRKNRDNVE